MKLSDIAVRSAKPKDKDYKLADGLGLHLLVKKNGSKYWHLKYRYLGKEKLLALGVSACFNYSDKAHFTQKFRLVDICQSFYMPCIP